MDNKRIAWVDDNINTQILKTYIDEFEDNGIEVVKIKTVEGLLENLKKELQNSLSAILIDIIMPPGNYDDGKTRGGLRTGIPVLEDILKEDLFKNIPIIVVTNVDDAEVTKFCETNAIPRLKKHDFFSDSFVIAVNEEIKKYNEKHLK